MESTSTYNPINRIWLSEWKENVKQYEHAIAPQPDDPEQDSDFLEWKEQLVNNPKCFTQRFNGLLNAHCKSWRDDRFIRRRCSNKAKAIKQSKASHRRSVEEDYPAYTITEHKVIEGMNTYTQWKAYVVKNNEANLFNKSEDFLFYLNGMLERLKRYKRISDMLILPVCAGTLVALDGLTNQYVSDETLNLMLNTLVMMFILLPMLVVPFVWLLWAIDKRIEFMEQYIKVVEVSLKNLDSIEETENGDQNGEPTHTAGAL